jgi:hypothetical protein
LKLQNFKVHADFEIPVKSSAAAGFKAGFPPGGFSTCLHEGTFSFFPLSASLITSAKAIREEIRLVENKRGEGILTFKWLMKC